MIFCAYLVAFIYHLQVLYSSKEFWSATIQIHTLVVYPWLVDSITFGFSVTVLTLSLI